MPSRANRRTLLALALCVLACVLAAAGALDLSTGVWSSGSTTNSDGTQVIVERSLWQDAGFRGLVLVYLPVLIVAVPLVLRSVRARRRYALAVGAAGVFFSLLATLSIGLF